MAGTETITLRLVAQDLMSGNVSKAIGSLDRLAKRGGLVGSVLQGMGQSMGQLINPVGLVANGIGMVTDAVGEAIDVASDLNEQTSKNTVVFKDQADEVIGWARSLDSAYGISERAALTFTGTIGNLATSMGVSADKAAEMSTRLGEIAGDLASFNNANISEVITALQSGLVGEMEPMRRFGAALSAARVEAKAAALGLVEMVKVGGKLKPIISEGAKVQARYALILEDTANAQGDAKRTADSLAGQQRRMNAEVENLQAKVGQLLVGPATGFLGFLNGIVDVIDGPDGASANIRDLTGTIVKLRTEADALSRSGPFEALANDLAGWNQQLTQAEELYSQSTWFQWMQRLGPDTLRNFGKASAETFADVQALATGVIEAGGSFEEFASIVRQKIAPSFNILTSTWGTFPDAVEEGTNEIVHHAGRIRAVPFQMLRSMTDIKAEWKSAWKNLADWAKHPFRPEAFANYVKRQTKKALEEANDPENSRKTRTNWRKIANAMKSPILGALVEMGMSLDEAVAKIIAVQAMAKRVDPLAIVVTGAGGGQAGGSGTGGNGFGATPYSLPAGGSGMGSGGHINVNVTHIGSMSEADGQRFARTVAPHINRELGRGGR